jgi:hypothetical protein
MDKDTDGKLFAAALYVITVMWGKEMGDLQRASLANQIVREIERRGIVMPAAAAEPPSSGDGANTDYVMVPRKASDEMVEQARMTLPGIVDICDADIEDIYETMIAAAPPSPRSDEGSGLTPHSAAVSAIGSADKVDWRQRYFEARDALFQFKYPPDPKLLREIADEIDCGRDCEHGNTEWDTNAHVCSRSERKEGCAGEKASCLRQFADAIDVCASLQREALGETPVE